MSVFLGPSARPAISLLILVSILDSMNGMILTGPRVYYAMARQGVFPRVFGQTNDRQCAPIAALMVQGVWAGMLAASGSYEQLFTDVILTAWIFLRIMLTVCSASERDECLLTTTLRQRRYRLCLHRRSRKHEALSKAC